MISARERSVFLAEKAQAEILDRIDPGCHVAGIFAWFCEAEPKVVSSLRKGGNGGSQDIRRVHIPSQMLRTTPSVVLLDEVENLERLKFSSSRIAQAVDVCVWNEMIPFVDVGYGSHSFNSRRAKPDFVNLKPDTLDSSNISGPDRRFERFP